MAAKLLLPALDPAARSRGGADNDDLLFSLHAGPAQQPANSSSSARRGAVRLDRRRARHRPIRRQPAARPQQRWRGCQRRPTASSGRWATTLARMVLPVPRWPHRSTPCGGSTPTCANSCGCVSGSSTASWASRFCASHPTTSSYATPASHPPRRAGSQGPHDCGSVGVRRQRLEDASRRRRQRWRGPRR
jgi:hypothetical protein